MVSLLCLYTRIQIIDLTDVGERRIRVLTTAVPTTSNLSEVFASADQVAIATLLANKAVERCITHKLEDSRDALFNKTVEILTAYKASMTAAGAGASAQLAISENLKMLPVLVLGLLKNVRLSALALLPMFSLWCRSASDKALKSLPISGRMRKRCSHPCPLSC